MMQIYSILPTAPIQIFGNPSACLSANACKVFYIWVFLVAGETMSKSAVAVAGAMRRAVR